jgi:SAM-dependent methyltransferase
LGNDPIFRALLEQGLLQGTSRILDLGCGQGLLTAWLSAASRLYQTGNWPTTWPAPPQSAVVRGIDLKAREVRRAQRAFGPEADIEVGDIRDASFGSADAVVLLDVLHYVPPSAQRDVLQRIRNALPPGGILLLRVGDAGSGYRYRITHWVDKVFMLLRGHGWLTVYCRSVADWRALLREIGFDSKVLPMSQGTLFANVLLSARSQICIGDGAGQLFLHSKDP